MAAVVLADLPLPTPRGPFDEEEPEGVAELPEGGSSDDDDSLDDEVHGRRSCPARLGWLRLWEELDDPDEDGLSARGATPSAGSLFLRNRALPPPRRLVR